MNRCVPNVWYARMSIMLRSRCWGIPHGIPQEVSYWYAYYYYLSTLMIFPKKVIDNRKKNTVRKISIEVAEEVIRRDRVCIICHAEPIEEIHHVFYWYEAQHDVWRNNPDRLVWLGRICHHKLHFEWWNNYRQRSKDYLKNLYPKNYICEK